MASRALAEAFFDAGQLEMLSEASFTNIQKDLKLRLLGAVRPHLSATPNFFRLSQIFFISPPLFHRSCSTAPQRAHTSIWVNLRRKRLGK
jgi:hypothetical protein